MPPPPLGGGAAFLLPPTSSICDPIHVYISIFFGATEHAFVGTEGAECFFDFIHRIRSLLLKLQAVFTLRKPPS